MKKRQIAILMSAVLLAGAVWGCAGAEQENRESPVPQEQETETSEGQEGTAAKRETGTSEKEEEKTAGEETAEEETAEEVIEIPPVRIGPWETLAAEIDGWEVTPCVEPYTINEDLSNVENLQQFYLDDEETQLLAENGFYVSVYSGGDEFFDLYELNRYEMIPSFVTVDSLMHTYHLYFSGLLKHLEKDELSNRVLELSRRMLADSEEMFQIMKGSEWESAAKRNLVFFSTAASLMNENVPVPSEARDEAEAERARIMAGEGILTSDVTGGKEDYSQYIPRGYYEGDEQLERYFRTMMLYGRVHFSQGEEDLDRSALLISLMLSEDEDARQLWQSVYDITSFFAGNSDDLGVDQYLPAMTQAYGDGVTADALIGNEAAFERFRKTIALYAPPAINSVLSEGSDNAARGFRFMGQRFTIDGAIMQKLVHDSVPNRLLPDALDVPAALGSDTALEIMEENGSANYEGYEENMKELRTFLGDEKEEPWTESLYSGWLNTLRPLLEEKGEGYPMFMQNREWLKKDLECFAGSFTELKHDTILYTKQVMAEMGGGYDEIDDRGYVEPEPLVYARFAALADRTAEGLASCGMLREKDQESLSLLSQMARALMEISVKELRDETLTDDEYELIRGYGGSLEHFWMEAVNDGKTGEEIIHTRDCPAAVVVDVAYGNGEVLELATNSPSVIMVVVKVDGKLRIAKGCVYSFYQFPWPADDRLTDTRWRQMLGLAADEAGNYNPDYSITKPEWTMSYRGTY